jgi:hypothetical protein
MRCWKGLMLLLMTSRGLCDLLFEAHLGSLGACTINHHELSCNWGLSTDNYKITA